MADDIRIVVEGFRGIRRAEIGLAPLALVGGPNEAGKTSLVQAVAAAVTGNAIPLLTMRDGRPRPALAKLHASALVHHVYAAAHASVATDRGEAVVSWPACTVSTDGHPLDGSIWATGLAGFADIDPGERAVVLIDLLKAVPGRDDLVAALDATAAGLTLSQDNLERLWSTIETLNWDGAHERARERGATLKGQWREVAGEAWGRRKAASWLPAGWDEELAALEPEAIEAARGDLDRLRGDHAVGEAEISRKREQAAGLEAAEAEAAEAKQAAEQARSNLAEALQARSKAVEVTGDSGLPCPWCSHNVRIGRGPSGEMQLERFELTLDKDEHTRLHRELVRLDAGVSAARAAEHKAIARETSTAAAAEACREAAASLDGLVVDEGVQAQLEQAREHLKRLEAQARAQGKHARALELSEQIETNAKIVEVLAPSGLRQTKLAEALAGFNARLAALAKAADWPAPAIGEDMAVMRGREPYALLSRSAQYRANVVLQIALAELENSGLLIIDGIDIFDVDGRNGLFALLEAAGKPALITATYSSPRFVPDLDQAGLGHSYWLFDRVCLPLRLAPPAEEAE